MTQTPVKYREPLEISVVVTPWGSEYLVAEHYNPNPLPIPKEDILDIAKLNHGKDYYSLGKTNKPIEAIFPKWLMTQPNLKITPDKLTFTGFTIDGGTIKDLFSNEYITKKAQAIKKFHEKLQNDPQIKIGVQSLEKYKENVKYYFYQIILEQLVINSAPKPAMIFNEGSPHEMFFSEKGFILSYAGINYSAGPAHIFKIIDTDKQLHVSTGVFPYYSIFTENPISGKIRYLSPGECACGDLTRLKKEKRLFEINDHFMIIQSENNNLSMYDTIK